MNEFNLDKLLRDNIRELIPYSSARDEFSGNAGVFLDANENSFGSPLQTAYNRYPDPLQWKLKEGISRFKGVPPRNIFLGNGSDEAIDLLFRAFCRPGADNVIVLPPTYGMYEVSARINDIAVGKIRLTDQFQPDVEGIAAAVNEHTKLLFICSPNNPTGNSMNRQAVEMILNNFQGLVVVDEAYINFSKHRSFIQELTEYPNLVVLQTFSKAWGLAALRLGMAFASGEVIDILNKIKPPYNISEASQQLALEALENIGQVNGWIKLIVKERDSLQASLSELPLVEYVYPSDANFLLVKSRSPHEIYQHLVRNGIVVRDRSKVELCEGCLRITVGKPEENEQLLDVLKMFNV